MSEVVSKIFMEKCVEEAMRFDEAMTSNMPITNAKDLHRQKMTEYFQAMTREEMELFVDIVPVDICIGRIQKELDKAKEFENAIKAAMNVVV